MSHSARNRWRPIVLLALFGLGGLVLTFAILSRNGLPLDGLERTGGQVGLQPGPPPESTGEAAATTSEIDDPEAGDLESTDPATDGSESAASPGASLFDMAIDGEPPYTRAPGEPNRLAGSRSTYLRSAAEQPVSWMEWGEEAFALAAELDRPIYLDIGAVWCHWCHVMDRQSYEDATIAAYINAHFVPVKVDRDARPDIDRRYQQAVQAIAQSGGWPLTAFLTPAGKVFFGGTYFPPRTEGERTGLDRLLPWVAGIYASERETIWQRAEQLSGYLAEFDAEMVRPGTPSRGLADTIAKNVLEAADLEQGGWGQGPSRFPNLGAVQLMLHQYERTGEDRWLEAATRALDAMALGGMRDQLQGGLFRYSTDASWRVPHFEKMSYVNAEALSAYAQAWKSDPRPHYRQTALEIVDYVMRDAARPGGGFYATQDADVSLDDDGSWFSWTLREAEAVLSADEAAVLLPYYGITARPSAATRELPGRNVLSIRREIGDLAAELGLEVAEVERRLESGRAKMVAARRTLPAPLVDQTIYAAWNGLMISGFLDTAETFDRPDLRAFAIATADFILAEMLQPDGSIYHAWYEGAPHVEGQFEDHAQMALALLDLWDLSEDERYLEAARSLMDHALAEYWDDAGAAFFDIPSSEAGLALLERPSKPFLDLPTPGANPVAVRALLRLAAASGEPVYAERAQQTLAAFAGGADHLAAPAAGYVLALDAWLEAAGQP